MPSLHEVLTTSVDGHPALVLVHGEPGVGKTRLLREVTDAAAGRGHHVLWGPPCGSPTTLRARTRH